MAVKKSAWTSLPVQMMVGLVLGVVVGMFISSDFATTYLKPLGDLFIRLIRMVGCALGLCDARGRCRRYFGHFQTRTSGD